MSETVFPTLALADGRLSAHDGSERQSPKRYLAFAVVNLLFGFTVASLELFGEPSSQPSTLYLLLLCLLCSSPLLLCDRFNGPYSILIVFTPIYFMFYGMGDLIAYVPGMSLYHTHRPDEFLTEGESAILLGAACLIAGYFMVALTSSKSLSKGITRDWSVRTIVILGLIFWAAGLWATWIWQFRFADTRMSTMQESNIGALLTLFRMLQPVGSTLISYAYLKTERTSLLCLLITLMAIELPFGLIADSKELAIRTGMIFIFAKWLYDGSVPSRWVIVAAITIVTIFPIFQAYRYEVLQARSNSREKAIQNLSRSLELAFDSRSGGKDHELKQGVRAFSGRIDLKGNMELIVRKTGRDVPFQNGYTISLLSYALIPRLVLPDKPDSSVGQIFNRAFHVSLDPDTYISATHLGELFWNYGWTGVIIGMLAIGAIMGTVSCGTALADHQSVTRLLLMISTVYLLGLRFEGGIAMQYTQWIRSLCLIAVLHVCCRTRAHSIEP